MKDLVYLDSGIFIAFLNRRDQWHSQAVSLFGTSKPRWSTSLPVVSETYSWFLHRMGEEAARTFANLIGSLDGLRLFEAAKADHDGAMKMLTRFRGSKLTYVDAYSLQLIEKNHIARVWSTDHHLSLTGAEMLPRT